MKIERVYRKDLGEYRWKIDLTISGKRFRRADFVTKREAIEAIAIMHSLARARRFGLLSPKSQVTLRDLQDKVKPSPVFDSFVLLVSQKKQIADLERADWKKFVDTCKDRGLKPASINRYLAEVSGVLRSVPEYFPDLKDWHTPKAPWESEPLGRERVLAAREIQALIAGFRAERQYREKDFSVRWRHEILDLFRLMLLTVAREGELLNLKTSQISWDWRTVQIESKKGGLSRRVIPLSDGALEILKSRQTASQRIFKQIPKNALYHALERVGQISGVPYGERIQNGWVIYDLRHLAATIMENAGIPYSAVSAILGHKRRDQTATYTHADLTVMRRGIVSLESWCQQIDGFFSRTGQIQTTSHSLIKSAGV